MRSLTRFAKIVVTMAVLSGIAEALAGFGTRWGWWRFTVGFSVLAAALLCALLAVAGSFILLCRARAAGSRAGFVLPVVAFLIGAAVATPPLYWIVTARRVPPINDITTDTADPPRFKALLAARGMDSVPAAYGGPQIAQMQKAAYPAVVPLILPPPPEKTYEKALAAAHARGWTIVAGDKQAGRIEATARTFWFGFTDDIVIRIRPEGSGSRVDVRSHSRVGKSDLGTNAKRIIAYLALLKSLP